MLKDLSRNRHLGKREEPQSGSGQETSGSLHPNRAKSQRTIAARQSYTGGLLTFSVSEYAYDRLMWVES